MAEEDSHLWVSSESGYLSEEQAIREFFLKLVSIDRDVNRYMKGIVVETWTKTGSSVVV